MIYLIPIIALALLVIDYRVTANMVVWVMGQRHIGSMDLPWNGYGCVHEVIKGRAELPMQYRVFVPWLTWLLGESKTAYMIVKYAGLLFMLYGFHWYLGVLGVNADLGTALLGALVPLTILYDYADAYWELGFFAVGFGLIYEGGNIWVLTALIFMACLNRETAVFLVLAHYVALGHFIPSDLILLVSLIVAVVGIGLPTLIYGHNSRYCPLNLINKNIQNIKARQDILGYATSLVILLGFVSVVVAKWNIIQPTLVIVMSVFIIVISIPGLWNETRIFMPTLVITIPLAIS